jgi:hypothetical protein
MRTIKTLTNRFSIGFVFAVLDVSFVVRTSRFKLKSILQLCLQLDRVTVRLTPEFFCDELRTKKRDWPQRGRGRAKMTSPFDSATPLSSYVHC